MSKVYFNTTLFVPLDSTLFTVWTTCPYYTRDGVFNPDARLVNDTGQFAALADAVLYNSLAWALEGYPTPSNYTSSIGSYTCDLYSFSWLNDFLQLLS